MLISHTDLDHISGVQELLTLKEKHLTTLRIKSAPPGLEGTGGGLL